MGDFLDAAAAEKAGIIEARMGSSAPLPFGAFLGSPALPSQARITGLEYDSRQAGAGSLYFALPGLHVDGHDYAADAANRGAAAVVHQKDLSEYREGVLYLRAKDSRFAMSPIADAFYDFPSSRMGIIGVTGTEGKSTTVALIYQLLKLLGKKTGFISTVQHGDGICERWNSEHQTTPEAAVIHRLLAQMRENGAEFVVLESSSHGLSKRTNRLGDVSFDVGIMTNVTHDHLEFHGTWEQYRSDKAELFRSLGSSPSREKKVGASEGLPLPTFGVVNADDPSADYFAAATKYKTYRFSTKGAKADLSLRLVENGSCGNWYEVFVESTGSTLTLRDQLPGAFNVGNVLAALLAVSNLLSIKVEDMADIVAQLQPVRGRMTAIRQGQPFEVMIDYAHTPSSFEAVLPPLRDRLGASGKLICLFGSPGERDTQKRPLQGEVAARFSDIVILADEDPRGEDPMAILEEIASGCDAGGKLKRGETLLLIPDRAAAIRKAFSFAQEGDIVILLGKGHENSIIYADKTISYDEIKEAQTALEEAGYPLGSS